ncbi:metal-sensitive transcriptional regulator [Arthrobacter sp. EpRS71]|uniref:metal-sensitive transcriptional regulator n=1 Tax=Arthrobacter sp. EpRS71 TaxID=1743141 RepID=UPI000747E911|nr:metal-sensitive transcriptional regulator [Arthrobacter sp. EpRS71]KUM36445.1 hypothetical protein AR689_21230 [Arthrobacter sp. EpRS71]
MYPNASTARPAGHLCGGSPQDTGNKARYVARLRRMEGQAQGIARMFNREQYCLDILTQVSALSAALRSLGLGLVDDHMKYCVLGAVRQDPRTVETLLREVSEAIARLRCG